MVFGILVRYNQQDVFFSDLKVFYSIFLVYNKDKVNISKGPRSSCVFIDNIRRLRGKSIY